MKLKAMLVSVVVLLLAAWPCLAGLYVEQTVESTGEGMNLKVKAWTEAERARIEFVESDSLIMPPGSYLLTLDGGNTVVLIKPSNQTFSIWDLDLLYAGTGLVDGGAEGLVDIDFDNPGDPGPRHEPRRRAPRLRDHAPQVSVLRSR